MDACAVHSSLWEILEQITENLKSKRLSGGCVSLYLVLSFGNVWSA